MSENLMEQSGRNTAAAEFIGRAFPVCCLLGADTVMLGFGAGISFLREFFVVAFLIGALRLRIAGRKRTALSTLLAIAYAMLYAMSVDFYIPLAMALYSKSPWLFAVPAALFAALLAARRFYGLLSFMSPWQLFAFPLAVSMPLLVVGGSNTPCGGVNERPGLRVLMHTGYELKRHDIPRFFIHRPGHNDILVCNHTGSYREGVLSSFAVNRLDLDKGFLMAWLPRGEALGVAMDEKDGVVYALLRRNYVDVKAPNVSLVKISPDGKILDSDSLGLKRNTWYIGLVEDAGDHVLAVVEGNYYFYEKKTGRLRRAELVGGSKPIYSGLVHAEKLYASHATNPAMMFLSGSNHAMRIDLKTLRIERRFHGLRLFNPLGYYNVVKRPGRDEFVFGEPFTSGGVMLNGDLKLKKKMRLPPGVREIEFTKDGRYLLAIGHFNGMLYVIDPDTDEILKREFVGRESRGVMRLDDGRFVVGSSCGTVLVDSEKFLAGVKGK